MLLLLLLLLSPAVPVGLWLAVGGSWGRGFPCTKARSPPYLHSAAVTLHIRLPDDDWIACQDP